VRFAALFAGHGGCCATHEKGAGAGRERGACCSLPRRRRRNQPRQVRPTRRAAVFMLRLCRPACRCACRQSAKTLHALRFRPRCCCNLKFRSLSQPVAASGAMLLLTWCQCGIAPPARLISEQTKKSIIGLLAMMGTQPDLSTGLFGGTRCEAAALIKTPGWCP
jgi:hypothetical protein